MLSVVSWDTDASGSWTDPTKWSTGQVPGVGDDVIIDRPGASPTVTLTGVGETAYHTVTIKDTLELSGGKLITTADSQISGHLILDGGTIQVNSGTLTLSGPTDWTSGQIAGGTPVVNAATMTISGASPKDVGGAGLANTGTIDLAGGAAFGLGNNYGGGALDNRAGGLIDLQGDVSIGDYPGGAIRNAGTLRKSAGTSSTIGTGAPFANAGGTIDVRSGTLTLALGGASTGGTFDAAAGATLHLHDSGGPGSLAGSYTGAGGGTVLIDFANGMNADGTTLDFPAGMLDWAVGTVFGTVTNAGSLTVTRAASGSPVVGGTLINTGTIALDASAPRLVLGSQYGPGALDNRAGGLVDIQGDGAIGTALSQGTFKNAGTLRKSAGTGSPPDSGVAFASLGGTVDVRSGALTLYFDASTGGTFDVAAGATLDFKATSADALSGTYIGSGGGAVLIEPDAFININTDNATLNFPAGMLRWVQGTVFGTVTNAGSLTVTGSGPQVVGGTLINTGTLLLDASAANVSVGTQYGPGALDNRAGGLVEIQGGVNTLAAGGTASFTNEGTVQIDAAADPRIAVAFTNTGSLVLRPGAGATVNIGGGGTLPSGTYDVGAGATLNFANLSGLSENDATILLRGAGASVPALSGLSVNKGTLEVGPGVKESLSGGLTNAGTLAIDAGGELDVAGAFAQQPAATLTTQLGTAGGTPAAGLVKVSGAAALGGTLDVTQAAGFALATGQTFTPLTFASATGAFAHLAGLASGRAPAVRVATAAAALTLSTGAAADLAVTSVTAPSGQAAIGSTVTVGFAVKDLGAATTAGSWDDSVYLSPDGTISPDAILLGRVTHTGDVAAGGNYSGSLTASLPSVAARAYHVVVLADSAGHVADLNRANNLGAAPGTIAAGVPALALDGPAISDTIAPGQERLYRLDVPAGATVRLTLTGTASLLARYGDLPTDSANDGIAADPTSGNQVLTLASGRGGPVYLLVRGPASGAAGPFTLSAASVPFQATSLGPGSGPAQGTTAVTIRGAGFSPTTTVSLVRAGERIAASQVILEDDATIDAIFNLSESAPALYDVEVDDAGRSSTLARSFTTFVPSPTTDPNDPLGSGLYAAPNADYAVIDYPNFNSNMRPLSPTYLSRLAFDIEAPPATRVGHDTPVTITYTNKTDSTIPAPLFEVTRPDTSFYLPGAAGQVSDGGILLLGINQTGPAGWLPPHDSGQITVMAHVSGAVAHEEVAFSLYPVPDYEFIVYSENDRIPSPAVPTFEDSPSLDPAILAAMMPAGLSAGARALVSANLTASLGTTMQSLEVALGRDASYLASIGRRTADVGTLLAFEKSRATAFGLLDAMGRLGSLGYGRFTADDLRATEPTGAGPVLIQLGAQTIEFDPSADGSYASPAAPGAALTVVNGAVRIRDRSGDVIAFNPDGTYHSTAQPDGTAVVAAYSGGHIATLTDSLGQVTSFVVDANGRITRITDPAGRVTTFGYDPTDTLLTGVTDASGTTQYQYGPAGDVNGARATVLTAVIDPSGVKTTYTYDGRGRVVGTDVGGVEPTTLSYSDDQPGAVAVKDATGTTSTYLFDAAGDLAGIIDANGHRALATVDAHGNVTGFTDPNGNVTAATYDGAGNLLSLMDPLGARSRFSYDPAFAQLTSFTDPLGNLTTDVVNDRGQTIRTTYADGSTETFAYNGAGLVAATDRSGQTTTYAYAPSSTDITGIVHGDGTQAAYTYDAHHNLLTATNAQGTTTFTYDAADRMTSVNYPNGLALHFTYDADGRRTRMSDQSGYAVNDSYDAAGRLASLSDDSGHVITSYTYDAAGRLARVDQANGTATVYTYDASSNIAEVDNLAADRSILSKFAYIYDAAGNPLTMTTLDGTTTYTYDADGQLIRAVLPGGRTLTYAYDAAGNRVSATDSGTTTAYATNNLNEYTAAGATTYRYDANGDLISRTDATGTTTYTYDADGHLTQVVSPTAGTYQYLYDALGNRIATIHNGTRTDELFDPSGDGQLVGQFSGSTPVDRYVYGLGLAAQVDATGRANAYSFDAVGNTATLTGPTGAVLDRYTYLPFGGLAGSAGAAYNPFTFIGAFGVLSDGNGLAWMRNREYDPATGRFTRPDPLGLAGGLNAYAYVRNDPTQLIDPSGTLPKVPGIGNSPSTGDRPRWPGGNGTGTGTGGTGTGTGTGTGGTGTGTGTGGTGTGTGTGGTGTSIGEEEEKGLSERFRENLEKNFKNLFYIGVGVALVGFTLFVAPPAVAVVTVTLGVAGTAYATTRTEERASNDPNDIAGPAGYGPPAYVAADQPLPYTILFENQPTASAAAATVTITETLSPGLDGSTFQLGTIQFGAIDVTVPAGLSSYHTRVDARATLGVLVDVDAALDPRTGVVTWTLRALDPTTLDTPADPTLGLLPPDDATGRGEGSVSYTIRPKAGATTGTTLTAAASIVFDANAAIATPTASNTIDAAGPTATIRPLPSVVAPTFSVSWAGADDRGGSGVATYDVYESIDGGPFDPLLIGTTATSQAVQGAAGHTYGFAVVATDNVGHSGAPPTVAQATTMVVNPSPAVTLAPAGPIAAGATFTGSGSFADNFPGPYTATVDYGDGSGASPLALRSDGSFTLSHAYAQAGTYTVTVTVTDPSGTASQRTLSVKIVAPTPTPTPLPVSGFGADRDAFTITLYRELLGRLPTQAELVAAASKLKRAAAYKALLKKLTRSKEYRQAKKLHRGTGIAPSKAYRDAIAARNQAGAARVAVRIATAHPRGPLFVGARTPGPAARSRAARWH